VPLPALDEQVRHALAALGSIHPAAQ
jgi:hypothetical protein